MFRYFEILSLSSGKPCIGKYSFLCAFNLSVSTILTTLIAAWLKKNNYVERINELDKYLHKTMKLYYELESISLMNIEERMLYAIFEEKYNDTIISLFADSPSYSPYKYKKILQSTTQLHQLSRYT